MVHPGSELRRGAPWQRACCGVVEESPTAAHWYAPLQETPFNPAKKVRTTSAKIRGHRSSVPDTQAQSNPPHCWASLQELTLEEEGL